MSYNVKERLEMRNTNFTITVQHPFSPIFGDQLTKTVSYLPIYSGLITLDVIIFNSTFSLFSDEVQFLLKAREHLESVIISLIFDIKHIVFNYNVIW